MQLRGGGDLPFAACKPRASQRPRDSGTSPSRPSSNPDTGCTSQGPTPHASGRSRLHPLAHSVLASTIVTNYNLPRKKLWITVPVGVAYDSDLAEVERISVEVGNKTLDQVQDGSHVDPTQVRYRAFGDSSIDFDVLLSVTAFTDEFRVRHEFIKRLHKRFGEEGIEIPFPIRTLVMQGPPIATTRSDDE